MYLLFFFPHSATLIFNRTYTVRLHCSKINKDIPDSVLTSEFLLLSPFRIKSKNNFQQQMKFQNDPITLFFALPHTRLQHSPKNNIILKYHIYDKAQPLQTPFGCSQMPKYLHQDIVMAHKTRPECGTAAHL